jgi:hypothetical protein
LSTGKKIPMPRIGKTAWPDSWDPLRIRAVFVPFFTENVVTLPLRIPTWQQRSAGKSANTLHYKQHRLSPPDLTIPLYFRHTKVVLHLSWMSADRAHPRCSMIVRRSSCPGHIEPKIPQAHRQYTVINVTRRHVTPALVSPILTSYHHLLDYTYLFVVELLGNDQETRQGPFHNSQGRALDHQPIVAFLFVDCFRKT